MERRDLSPHFEAGSSADGARQQLDDLGLYRRGEFVVLLGASGSGKSTLLNILGGLDVATRGEVRFGRANQVPVALAAQNGTAAWIKSGLTTGQQVIVYPPATVRDGIRIAARKV